MKSVHLGKEIKKKIFLRLKKFFFLDFYTKMYIIKFLIWVSLGFGFEFGFGSIIVSLCILF